MELEAKAFGTETPGLEVKRAFEDFLAGFEAFKQGNDERLKGLEKRSADVLLDEKVDRINKALESQQRHLDTLLLDAARPALGGERKSADPRGIERKQAFDRYARKGDAGGLDSLELKAMSEGTNADGGYTVPLEIERTIDRVLAKASPIRSIATVRQIGSGTYRKPITTAGAASGWVGETGSISQSGTPGFGVLAQQAWKVMPNHQGVTRPAEPAGQWQAASEPFGHLALWGVKDLYALVEDLSARVAALEAAHAAG